MGTIYNDLPDHEGYAARKLGDGTMTSSWTAATAAFEAYVAKCGCGWTGGHHPSSEEGYEQALDEWAERHAQPLLERAVPASVAECIADVKAAVEQLGKVRPLAGLEALSQLDRWTEAAVARLRGGLGLSGTGVDRAVRRGRRRL